MTVEVQTIANTEKLIAQAAEIADILATAGVFGNPAEDKWVAMEKNHFMQRVVRDVTEPSPFSQMELNYLGSTVQLTVKTRVGHDAIARISEISAGQRFKSKTVIDFEELNAAMKKIAPTL